MKEINPLLIDENTEPSFETDVAKWYLLKKGEKYACWRWDSKKNDDKKYLITTLDGKVVRDTHLLEGVFATFRMFEAVEGK